MNNYMSVADLIELLKTCPQDMLVGISRHSEHCLLQQRNVQVLELCKPRSDGWIHDKRPDMDTQNYLIINEFG